MDKVLITGANGCVGYEMIIQLSTSYDIIALDRSFTNLEAFQDRIKCVKADIRDLINVEENFEGVDYVIHLAAKVHESAVGPEADRQFELINTVATKDLFELCLKYKVKKVVFFSTIAVYGNTKGPINEETPVHPLTPYARSKFEAEKIGMKLHKEEGLPVFILRPATIYGSLDRGNYRTLIAFLKKGLGVIPGLGLNYKPVLYVKDAAAIVAKILAGSYESGQTLIICQGTYRYKDIIGYIKRAYSLKTFNIYIPLFIIDFLNKCLKISVSRKLKTLSESIEIDNRKLLETFGYKPEYDFLSGLRDSGKYYCG